MSEPKIAADLEQFKGIVNALASKCGSLEDIGISPDVFKADARSVIATHVNNICADRLNSPSEQPAEQGAEADS